MSRAVTVAALIYVQVIGATPAVAANPIESGPAYSQRMGAFAGARLRVRLGRMQRERIRAGLTLAPLREDRSSSGASRFRMGEGLEFGISDQRGPALSFGGRSVRELVPTQGPNGARRNLSPVAWAGIGVGVAAIAFLAWYIHAGEEATQ
jgi:hypothetical protein